MAEEFDLTCSPLLHFFTFLIVHITRNCIIIVAIFALLLSMPGFRIYMEITQALSSPRVDNLVVQSGAVW